MNRTIWRAVALAFMAASAEAQTVSPPAWMNTMLSPDARASLLQAQMTQTEQLTLVDGYIGLYVPYRFHGPVTPELRAALPQSAGYVPGIPRLGIPPLNESDASLGVANGGHMRPGDQATALPSSLLTAATWNPDIAYAGGAMIGTEARDKGYNVLLAGGVDLAREPRGGRTFEYAGEDPWLAGTMVGAAIKGTQDQHIISTTKHFAINDQETARTVVSADISDEAMRESDLLAFEIAVERGDPGAVMCSYNRVNNVYACENDYLLNQVLKQDWSYKGFVLSDWGAVHSTADAADNGLDQESANGYDVQDFFGAPLKDALANGSVPETRLSDMVHRILRTMFAKGLFDYPLVRAAIDAKADGDVAQRDAEEGIVLLKNERDLLPLDPKPKKTQSIAVIGGYADRGVYSGGGSSQVIPVGNDPDQEILVGGAMVRSNGMDWTIPKQKIVLDPPSPLSAIVQEAPRARVTFNDGDDIDAAAALAKHSDIAIVFVHQWMREGVDVSSLSLYGDQDALVEAVAQANPHTIVVLETGGPVLMPWLDNVQAAIEAFYPGNRGALALARILFGEVDPSGRLPITFPRGDSQLPHPIITGQNPVGYTVATVGTPTAYDIIYTEGAKIGYKWFEDQKIDPLFPFGYGLSYTSFTLGGLGVTGGHTISASFDVKNTGKREGKETAELYAIPPGGLKRLIGFAKVDLMPGETQHVTLTADPRLLASFDTDAHLWRVPAGDYTVTLGSSVEDAAATATAQLEAGTIKP
jgi:beta-glucosidase